VLQALQRRDGTLTNLAKRLLDEAAKADPIFVDILVEELA
jgi:hypothetical protein